MLRSGKHRIASENTVCSLRSCLSEFFFLLILGLINDFSNLHMFRSVQCQDGIVNGELGNTLKIAMFAFFKM